MSGRQAVTARPEIWIIGAGWAGLAAATALSRAGFAVGLIEHARQPGGRARDIEHHGQRLDNGQHLLLGAYTSVLELLALGGLQAAQCFERAPLNWEIRDRKGTAITLSIPPASSILVRGLAILRGLRSASIPLWSGLAALLRMRKFPQTDCSVTEWLQQLRQPAALTRVLWQPLCLAALNTHPQQASARSFARVLRDSFAGPRGATDLLLPRRCLGSLVAQPLLAQLRSAPRNEIRMGTRVLRIDSKGAGFQLHTRDRQIIQASCLLVAVGWQRAAQLLAPIEAMRPVCRTLAHWQPSPITTIYLGFDPGLRLPQPLIGLLDGPAEWLIDRHHCGQNGVLAAVISADHEARSQAKSARVQAVLAQLRRALPHLPTPQWHVSVTEHRATYRCDPANLAQRPANATPVPGLWLAGDFTDTGLPATLEGAVRSGFAAARSISARHSPPITSTGPSP